MTIDFEIIEKENIGTLKFPHSEVLEDVIAIKERIRTNEHLPWNIQKFKFTLKMIDQKKW
jgi:hypothetical protein